MLERPLACRRAAALGHVVALIVLVAQRRNPSALHRDDGTGIARRASLGETSLVLGRGEVSVPFRGIGSKE